MTTMIYRGCTNMAPSDPVTHAPRRLVYRSVAHDGMTRQSPRRSHAATMSYRGVAHSLAPAHPTLVEDSFAASPIAGSALA